jgi:hypothetical protein
MKKVIKKAKYGFAKCNFQNSDKKYLAYGVRTKAISITYSSPLPAAVMKPV